MELVPTCFLVGHEIGEGNYVLITYVQNVFGLSTCLRVIVADSRSVPNIPINQFVNSDKRYDERSRDRFVTIFEGLTNRSLTFDW